MKSRNYDKQMNNNKQPKDNELFRLFYKDDEDDNKDDFVLKGRCLQFNFVSISR